MTNLKSFLKNFIKKNLFELIALTLVLLLAAVSGFAYFNFDRLTESWRKPASVGGARVTKDKDKDKDLEQKKQEGILDKEGSQGKKTTPEENKKETTSSSPSSKPSGGNLSTGAFPSSQEPYISVRLTIDAGSFRNTYSLRIKAGSTVYDLLKEASKKYGFSLDVSYYSYGVFIEEIAGIRNNPYANKYWLYYVNGSFASVGASSKKLKEGDEVLWRYQTPQ